MHIRHIHFKSNVLLLSSGVTNRDSWREFRVFEIPDSFVCTMFIRSGYIRSVRYSIQEKSGSQELRSSLPGASASDLLIDFLNILLRILSLFNVCFLEECLKMYF